MVFDCRKGSASTELSASTEIMGRSRPSVAALIGLALFSACSVGKIGDVELDPGAPTAGVGSLGNPSVGNSGSTGSGSAGSTGSPSGTGGAGSTEPPVVPPASVACDGPAPSAVVSARVRRITANEYKNTLGALLGSDSPPAVEFPRDPMSNGYANKADQLRVSGVLARNLWTDTETAAAQAATQLLKAPSCQASGATEESCVSQLISGFASKAYRRPLEAAELTELVTVYKTGRDGGTVQEGVTDALRVVLQSAGMLYHTELGANPASPNVTLTGHEIANQLAYLITGAPPDAELLRAATAGELATAEPRATQAKRLLSLAGARRALSEFAVQWLEVSNLAQTNRDTVNYPNWPTLRNQALEETRNFFSAAVLDDNAKFADLFTANWTVASADLIKMYGATAGSAGRATLPDEQRSGVLTQASVLGVHAQAVDGSPIQRGRFVRVRLLCQPVPAPPKNLVITLPPADPNRTTRERFAAHSSDPTCVGCHKVMDPIGFGLSNYDAIGQFQTTEVGRPIDASGELVGTDVDGAFTGAVELSHKLASSELTRACFARQWMEYSTAQTVTNPAQCALNASANQFLSGTGTVKDLIVDLVRSDTFVQRTAMAK